MKTLLALSGGLDSVYLLYRLLTETDDEVHAFRCDFRDVEAPDPRAKPHFGCDKTSPVEEIAAANVVDWVAANVRPVASFEVVNIAKFEPGEWITPAVIRVAAAKMGPGNFDRFMTGRNGENNTLRPGPSSVSIYRAMWAELAEQGTLEFPLLDENKTKAHALAYLPEELADMTSSCHKPSIVDNTIVPCGDCPKCHMKAFVREQLALGKPVDLVSDLLLRKKGCGEYGRLSTVDPKIKTKEPPPFLKKSLRWTPPE